MRIKILFAVLLLVSALIPSVSASLIYQENGTSASCSGTWNEACANSYDNDWSTYGGSQLSNNATLQINYSKSYPSANNATWQVLNGTTGGSLKPFNLTINGTCFAQSPLYLKITSRYSSGSCPDAGVFSEWSCWTGSAWNVLYRPCANFGSDKGQSQIYEEAIFWNLNASITINAYNEKTLSAILFNVSFANSTTTKTWNGQTIFNQKSDNLTTGDTTITISSEGYATRKYLRFLTTTSDDIIPAYLLPTSQGQTVRFHIVTVAEQPIASVLSDAKLSIGGTYTTVDQVYSDSSGTSSFFLDPTSAYQFTFTHLSYTTSVISIMPSQQDYKITMMGTTTFLNNTFNYGDVTVRLTPTGTSLLRHSPGNTTLNYTVAAPSGDLDGYGWLVKYNGTTLYSNSVSGSPFGGTDSYFVNTSNLTGLLYVDMYYTKYGNTTWFTNIYTMNNITLGNNTLADIISKFGNTGTGGYGFKKTTLALIGFLAIIFIMSFVSQFAVAGAGVIGWMGLAFMWYAGLISASLLWLVGLSVIAVLVIRGGFN